MMSHSGGDDDGESSPPVPPPVLYDDLVEVRERARMLQTVLQGSSPRVARDGGELVKGMMAKLSRAMSMLGDTDGAAAPSSSGAGKGPGRGRSKPGAVAVASGPHRRSSPRRRTKSPFIKMVTATTVEDGKSWRKYGQKKIHDSTNPRSYYRCTHKPDQGCMATKQVQKSQSNPSELEISYYGHHTCRDPTAFSSLIVQGAVAATAPSDGANFISFAPINGAAASTSRSAFPHRFVKETTDHRALFSRFSSYSSSPALEGAPSGSLSHERFMQHAGGQLADVVGRTTSAFTVGSAPAEYWPVVEEIAGVDMDAGVGMDSFPSSPSSLGFMSRSLESFGCDDDLFGFDS